MTAERRQFLAYPFAPAKGLTLDPAYAAVRSDPGAVWVQLPYGEPAWLVTRYADARLVLSDPRFSRAAAAERDAPRLTHEHGEGGLLSSDPPDHARLRALMGGAFTARRIEQLRPKVADLAARLLDDMMAAGAPADFVEYFAMPLPGTVICELFGVPQADRLQFQKWSDATQSLAFLPRDEVEQNIRTLHEYIGSLVEQRRRNPADDLISAMIAASSGDDRLSGEELVELCVILLVAGHETTASQIANMLFVLLDHPEHWGRVRREPEIIPKAVEELMRFIPISVAAAFPRYATEDVPVGDVVISKGEPVMVALGAANRDGLRFDEPDSLRIDREDNLHVGFGHGIHFCLGAQLARVELQESLRAIVSRVPEIGLAGDIAWKTDTLIRGPRTMPVEW